MHINELPPELLVRIFYFVPQKDLVSCIQHVCNYFKDVSFLPKLWTECDCNIWQITEPLRHIYQVQSFVKDLVIPSKNLADIFHYCRQIKLHNVKSLHISQNITEDLWKIIIGTKFVEMFPNIESLSLHLPSEFSMDLCLRVLTQFNLKSFTIGQDSETSVDDALISFISTQTQLQRIRLWGHMKVTDGTFAKIINDYSNITMLDLGHDLDISNEVFTLSTSPLTLSCIWIQSDDLEDEGLESLLRRSSCLSSLHIDNCSSISNRGLQNIVICGDKLKDLSICFHDELNNKPNCNYILQIISCNCRRLQYLFATGCTSLNCSGVSELVQSCQDLTYISLSKCLNISDGMLHCFRSCMMLRTLCLEGIVNVSLNSVMILLKSCRNLEHFSLRDIEYLRGFEILDQTITCTKNMDIVPNFHCHVQWLDISCNRDVTNENILKLADLCTDLRTLILDFRSVREIDDTFFPELFRKCIFLTHVSLNNNTVYRF